MRLARKPEGASTKSYLPSATTLAAQSLARREIKRTEAQRQQQSQQEADRRRQAEQRGAGEAERPVWQKRKLSARVGTTSFRDGKPHPHHPKKSDAVVPARPPRLPMVPRVRQPNRPTVLVSSHFHLDDRTPRRADRTRLPTASQCAAQLKEIGPVRSLKEYRPIVVRAQGRAHIRLG